MTETNDQGDQSSTDLDAMLRKFDRPALFVEPARSVPTRWLNYEVRYVAAIAILVLGYLIVVLVALPTNAADPADRAVRSSTLLLPFIAAVASAIVIPGRADRRVLFAATAIAAVFPFITMIAMPSAYKLIFVILFSVFAGILVLAWLIVRDRRRVLYLLSVGALLTALVVTGVVTEAINGAGTLSYGWPLVFDGGRHIGDPADFDLARQSATIWFAQAFIAVATVVGFAWIGRTIASRIRYISPDERDARAAAALAARADKHPGRPAVNSFAMASLLFALLGGLISLVFGFVALSQIKRTGERGRGLAIAGIIIGFVWVLAIVAFFAIGITTGFRSR